MIVIRTSHRRIENFTYTTMIKDELLATWNEVIKINCRIYELNLHVLFKPTQRQNLNLIGLQEYWLFSSESLPSVKGH